MQAISARDSTDPRVTQAARQAVARAHIAPDAALEELARAVFWWIKANVRYVPESQLDTPLHSNDFIDQQLITPRALLAMPEPYGDCPHFSMLTAAMCRYWRIPTAFKTIAADRSQPHTFSHVYIVAQPEPGRFMPLDTSNAPAPDLEYATPTKAKLWPNHQDTSDKAMIRDARINNARIARLQLARLGYVDAEGNVSPDSPSVTDYQPGGTLYTPPLPTDSISAAQLQTMAQVYAATPDSGTLPAGMTPGTGIVASPAPSSGIANLLAAITTDASKIAAPLIATAARQQPYYITGSNGAQVLYDPNTGTVATAKTTITSDLAAGVKAVTSAIPSTYLLLGAVLIGLLAFSSEKGKR